MMIKTIIREITETRDIQVNDHSAYYGSGHVRAHCSATSVSSSRIWDCPGVKSQMQDSQRNWSRAPASTNIEVVCGK